YKGTQGANMELITAPTKTQQIKDYLFHLEIRGSTAKSRKTRNMTKILNKQNDSLFSVQQPK
ncbi:MAG: hypothetical protein PHF61_09435, partial [Bacteroidales bacterium]|nr:hypothetical protein [Bacteroidales bacterium]